MNPADTPEYIIEGGGRWGGIHARNLTEALNGRSPSAVSTSSPERRARWEGRGVRVFERGRLAEALASGEVPGRIGVVTVLPEAVADVAGRLIEAGRGQLAGLLIEKPIATSVRAADDLLKEAQEADIRVMMSGQTRYGHGFDEMTRDLRLSEMELLRLRRSYPYREGVERFGGVVWDLLIHPVVELDHLLSREGRCLDTVPIQKAEMRTTHPAFRERGIADTVMVELQIPNGPAVELLVCQNSPPDTTESCPVMIHLGGRERRTLIESRNGGEQHEKIYRNGNLVRSRVSANTVLSQSRDFLRALGFGNGKDHDDGLHLFNPDTEAERVMRVVRFLQRVEEAA